LYFYRDKHFVQRRTVSYSTVDIYSISRTIRQVSMSSLLVVCCVYANYYSSSNAERYDPSEKSNYQTAALYVQSLHTLQRS
jgi:hypothetical protein